MNDRTRLLLTSGLTLSLALFGGCSEKGDTDHDHDGDNHAHADGDTDGDGHAHADGDDDHAHAHGEEVDLGTTMVGEWEVTAAQGHGEAAPGKEMHIVVKLPFNDNGATTVRAWVGTEDRLLYEVGKGVYAPSHDDYDIHAMSPDPMPEGAKWWIEIVRPDGTKAVGSIDYR